MPLHRRFILPRKIEATILIVFVLPLASLLSPPTARPAVTTAFAQNRCETANFAGTWQNSNSILTISSTGDSARGTYVLAGRSLRTLQGKITGNPLIGEWYENGRSGRFVALLTSVSARSNGDWRHSRHLNVSFYLNSEMIENEEWSCDPVSTPASSDSAMNSELPTPTPQPTPNLINDDQDIDNFRTFDSLSQSEQGAVLTLRGPRLPKEYNANNFDMRIFVQGGAPLVIDYSLDSDVRANLSISVAKAKPFIIKLEPAKLMQRTIVLPSQFGIEPQSGKLSISALTANGEPANFRLYGIAMGQMGAQALNKLTATPHYAELAMARLDVELPISTDSFFLFPFNPPNGSVFEITVSQPATIKTGRKPKQEISFSFKSRSLFDNGRWELLLVNGLTESHVWGKNTGRIVPNKILSEKWDGTITTLGFISSGDHSLKVTAWRGDATRAFVIARAPANIVVVP